MRKYFSHLQQLQESDSDLSDDDDEDEALQLLTTYIEERQRRFRLGG